MAFLPVLQSGTPDTTRFMLLGYAFIIGLPLLYIISWFMRRRSLERDLETIDALSKEEKPAEQPGAEQRARAAAAPDAAQPADKPSRS